MFFSIFIFFFKIEYFGVLVSFIFVMPGVLNDLYVDDPEKPFSLFSFTTYGFF